MCSIVQIDMLSNGTMGSKLVTSLSARLIRMDPPYFGPERTGNTASDAMITETPAARNQRSPFPAPHMDLPSPDCRPRVAMAAPSDAYAVLRFRSCGGTGLVSRGSGRDGR